MREIIDRIEKVTAGITGYGLLVLRVQTNGRDDLTAFIPLARLPREGGKGEIVVTLGNSKGIVMTSQPPDEIRHHATINEGEHFAWKEGALPPSTMVAMVLAMANVTIHRKNLAQLGNRIAQEYVEFERAEAAAAAAIEAARLRENKQRAVKSGELRRRAELAEINEVEDNGEDNASGGHLEDRLYEALEIVENLSKAMGEETAESTASAALASTAGEDWSRFTADEKAAIALAADMDDMDGRHWRRLASLPLIETAYNLYCSGTPTAPESTPEAAPESTPEAAPESTPEAAPDPAQMMQQMMQQMMNMMNMMQKG